jgi:hypothetical protein
MTDTAGTIWCMPQTYSAFLKVPEAAEALGVCERTIRN